MKGKKRTRMSRREYVKKISDPPGAVYARPKERLKAFRRDVKEARKQLREDQ